MAAPTLRITDLRSEHHPTGLGLHVPNPRLSWRFEASDQHPRSWEQASYTVEVHRGDSIKPFTIEGSSPNFVAWPGESLSSGESAKVRVKSTSADGIATEWSAWATAEAALLHLDDWTAKFITAPPRRDDRHPEERGIRPSRFRKRFFLSDEHLPMIRAQGKARLYITALGLYAAYLNKTRIGDELLSPGWTSYRNRLQFQVFDVLPLLKQGSNVLSVEVAEGWYAGRIGWGEGFRFLYGDRLGVLAQLEVSESSSTPRSLAFRIVSDESWQSAVSPILGSDIYDGETYDLSQEVPDWHHADSAAWTKTVDTLEFPTAVLMASPAEPVKVTEKIKPVKILKEQQGRILVDFGQNVVGKILIPHLHITKPTGHRLRIRHGETDTVIFGGKHNSEGKDLVDWSPHFTFHGFRYAELEGWPAEEEAKLESITALVVHNDMTRTGFFECSNEDVNQLHRNITWSMRGNFVSIPMDCPQRDERLGWTADMQIFSPTASFIYDCMGFLGGWLHDLILDQKRDGGIVPFVVPNIMKIEGPWPRMSHAIWDDAVILVPWTLYQWFGDAGILEHTYGGMRDYLRHLRRGSDGLWDQSLFQLGDWLDPNAPPSEPAQARTNGVLIADAYLVRVIRIMTDISGILGHSAEEDQYRQEASHLRQAFEDKYITKAGHVLGDSQTAMDLALVWHLHDESNHGQRKAAAERLAQMVRYAQFRVSTGFAGTPLILSALSDSGYTNLAYSMLLEKKCPSWLYPVTMGSTTMWERWDSILEDGSVNPGSMTSFNHYCFGSVGDWIHSNVGGISPLSPGWRKFRVRPRPGGDITSARVEFLSPQGWVRVSWGVGADDGTFRLKLSVPPNSAALVQFPDGGESALGSGNYELSCDFKPEAEWPPKPLLSRMSIQTPQEV